MPSCVLNEALVIRNDQSKALKMSLSVPSIMANLLLQWSFRAVDIHDAGCPIKVVKADVLKETRLYGELHRFLSYILYMNGARIGEVPVNHECDQ